MIATMATSQAKFDLAKATYKDKLFKLLQTSGAGRDFGKTPDEVFDKISAYDPTHDKAHPHTYTYLGWMCRMILSDNPRAQDIYKIGKDLELFRQHRKKLPAAQQSIDRFTSIKDLDVAMRPFFGIDGRSGHEKNNDARKKAVAESRILYDGPAGRIVIPLTTGASQFWGMQSRWCISAETSDNYFDRYNAQGPILMLLPKGTGEKYAYHERERCIRNVYDEETDKVSPTLAEFLTTSLGDPDFSARLKDDKDAQILLQTLFLTLPASYHAVLDRNTPLPNELSPLQMLRTAADLLEDKDRYKMPADPGLTYTEESYFNDAEFFDVVEDGLIKLHKALKHPGFIRAMGLDEAREACDVLAREISMNDLVSDIEDDLARALNLTPEDLESPESVLAKLQASRHQVEALDGLGASSANSHEEAVCKQLAKVPIAYWDDKKFADAALECARYSLPNIREHLPTEALQHPSVLMKVIQATGVADAGEYVHGGECVSPKVWERSYEGGPLLDAILNDALTDDISTTRRVSPLIKVASVYAFTRAYTGNAIDYSPLIRVLDETYPHGVSDEQDFETLLSLEKLDTAHLIEATLERHPAWFDMVLPERHTERMALLSIQYDPDNFGEVAGHVIEANPSAFRGAFNALATDDPIREARAHYFAEKSGNSAAPAPIPPQ